jgi:hypothetical protein
MATKTKKNKTTQAALAVSMGAGAVKHYPAGAQVVVGGATLTPAQIQTKLQGFAQLRADVVAAKAVVAAKLSTEKAQATDESAFLGAFEQVVRGSFVGRPDVLGDFGLKAEKPRAPLTVEQKAAAAAKRASTRQARGTKGSKAKQAIHGDVTGVVVTPVTGASAAPAPSATQPTAAPTATPATTPAH